MPSFGQLTVSSSQFANKRGIYLGRRLTKFHAALYRRFGGRIGGHLPGWPEARIALVDHKGAKSGVKRTSPLMYLEDGNAADEERARLWSKFVAMYSGSEFYRRNARGRKIPIVILDPR